MLETFCRRCSLLTKLAILILNVAACNRPSEIVAQPAPRLAAPKNEAVPSSSPVVVRTVAAESATTLAATTQDSPSSLASNSSLSVMTWNLEWFFDDDKADNYSKLAKEQTAPSRAQWDWKRDAVAAVIHRADPSVVAMQEIESKRVLWYLTRSLSRNHNVAFRELCIEGGDVFTEQDVGMLHRTGQDAGVLLGIEPIESSTFGRSASMRKNDSFADVSKHLSVQFEVTLGDVRELVTITTVHLRAREEAVDVRTKQARTVHAWLADKIRGGENVIVLGDFNTEESSFPASEGSDMAAACGYDTPDTEDDLVDLHVRLPAKGRQTHLLAGKSFDRILVSPSLIEDDPQRVDLTLTKFERLADLCTGGNPDIPQEHWDNYWTMDDTNRDVSDHWPVMATFEFK